MMFDAGPPPKLWIPQKPAVIRPADDILLLQKEAWFAPAPFILAGSAVVDVTLQESEDYVSLAAGPTTTYTISGASLGAVGADRKIVVAAGGTRNIAAAGSITGITCGGFSMTEVISQQNGDGRGDTAIFIIDAGTGSDLESDTTGDVVITFDSTCYLYGSGVYRMTGASSTTAHDTQADTTGSPYSVSIDCPANGAIIGHVNINAGGGSNGWTNLTEDYEFGGGTGSGAHDEFATTQTGLSVSVTGPAGNGGLCAASWGP